MPGTIQKNITIERVLFKDLLKLSKQRFASQKDTEFQKRGFTANQAKKGIFLKNKSTRSFKYL